jgi:cytochrome c-type biogenesis protein CcmF
MFITFGRASLLLALGLALFGIGAFVYGARRERPEWVAAGRRSVFALFAVLTAAMAIIEIAFARSDFSFQLAATHSSTTTPRLYKLTSMWSSQEGSLLLWVWLLSGWSSLAMVVARKRAAALLPYAGAALLVFAAFFLGLSNFFANPMSALSPAPVEGTGLQPLLRYPAMAIHPPMLYSGYTLAIVPLAFAVSALISGRVDATWLRQTRRFALGSWLCLTFGILLGARWSWSELGWGGYWAWDPVENAALLPWLTGTAALHSLMVQERRGTLRVWNIFLALATGILAVIGTFLVRSGVLESIHAFGASTLGLPFVAFIALLIATSAGLVAWRRDALRSEARLDSLFSREAVFILNNLVLVGMCLVIMWGTFFPLISEAVTGRRAAVGPPWFGRYTVPLAIALVLLSGIGPLLAWRGSEWRSVRRSFVIPAGLAAAIMLVAVIAPLPWSLRAFALFAAAAFTIGAVSQDSGLAARARQRSTGRALPFAAAGLIARNRRRYGGFLAHAGFAVMLIGVAASSAFKHVTDVRLSPGQSASVGDYDVRYVRATAGYNAEKLSLGAVLDVRRDGKHVATLRPSRGYYPVADAERFGTLGRWFEGESTSEVGLRAGPRRDVWTAVEPDLQPLQSMIHGIDKRFPLAGPKIEPLFLQALSERYRLDPPKAAFRFIVSPMVLWVWIGGLTAVGGGLIAIWPAGARRRVRSPATKRARSAAPASA